MASGEARFDGLYDRHYREVLAYCLRRCDPVDGYAAANEVFEIAWRRIDELPGGERASVALHRGSSRRVEAAAQQCPLSAACCSGRDHGAGRPPDPETVVVQRSEYEQVLGATQRLSRRDQEVLLLAAWEGLPHAQIAEILSCSIAAVDQRLHRAKVRLAKECNSVAHEGPGNVAVGGDRP